jgi:hypothetical protein
MKVNFKLESIDLCFYKAILVRYILYQPYLKLC